MYNDGIRKYQETKVHSIAPEQIIVMLYEGIVVRLNAAREAAVTGDIKSRCTNLQKALAIITELDLCLDHAVGGDVAANLADVYHYMKRELLEAQLKGEVKPIDNVLRVIAPLLEAWRSIQTGAVGMTRAANMSGGSEDGPVYAESGIQEDMPLKEICVVV